MTRTLRALVLLTFATSCLACVEPLLLTRPDSGDAWSAPGTWERVTRDDSLLAVSHAELRSTAVARTLPSLMEPEVARAWVLTTADAAWPDARLVSSTNLETPSGRTVTEVSLDVGEGATAHRHDFYLFEGSDRVVEVVTARADLEDSLKDRRALIDGFTPGGAMVTRRSEDTARVGDLSAVALTLDEGAAPAALRSSLIARDQGKSVTLSSDPSLIVGRVITYDLPYPTTNADLAVGLLGQARERGEATEPADAWDAALVAREPADGGLSPMTHVHAIRAQGVRVHQITLSTPTALEARNLAAMLELVRALSPSP